MGAAVGTGKLVSSPIHITDSELLTLIGFVTPEEHSVIFSLSNECELNVRDMLRVALRYYQIHAVFGLGPLDLKPNGYSAPYD